MTDYQALIDGSEPFALVGYPWVRTLRAALIEATADRAEHDRQEREKAWLEGAYHVHEAHGSEHFIGWNVDDNPYALSNDAGGAS